MAKNESENTTNQEQGLDRNTLLLLQALEKIASRPTDAASVEIQERLTAALERVSDSNLKGAAMIARASRPSNEVVPMRSVFNQRGETLDDYKKPLLCCKMLIPWEAEDSSLTREEVELLNLVALIPGQYKIRRTDNTVILISVRVEMDLDETRPTKMLINHDTGFNNENFRLMPQLTNYLRQIIKQCHNDSVKAAEKKILTSEEELDLIEAGQLSVSA